ncbi:FKBP-type peptidyl-prolyl cis-trans isomerase [Thermoflexibacter ruber]|uniref:Peptidyl-prolyl cis-trans isomerase n=1 Tax=Thermoflexibacter ruber TaxID=1003 RepID=A0A1I2FZX3_9BACT|nr:FKBP-type peptidyl-prolyl cis-trans isomerase [Thermoflexibacter ruber]SFF10964.1 FKBP-type peptidyl-prolyl cis-trans isomerase [Thermoflexibacter ruber]
MKKNGLYFVYLFVLVSLSACLKSENSFLNQQQEDEQKILAYLNQNNINATRSPTGLYYVITQQGTGKKPNSLEEIANIDTDIFLLDGVKIITEKDFTFRFKNGISINGLLEATSLLNEGGSGRFFIPSDRAFGQGSGTINGVNVPANAILIAEVKLNSLRDDEQQKVWEAQQISNYFTQKNLTLTKDTIGVFYSNLLSVAEGTRIRTGNRVSISYKGLLLNGKTFDSGNISFAIGTGAVIQGLDIGIRLMKKGEKGILVIPSHLAYQDRGRGELIRPFDPLVFEIEVTNVE